MSGTDRPGLGRLFMLPVTLGGGGLETVIPAGVQARARTLEYFVAENAKSARAFLKQNGTTKPLQELHIATLDEHTREDAVAQLAAPLLAGFDMGMMSEAGCPGIADPGARLVRYAHRQGIQVVPLVGPSSILLALMASGLNGQRFAFHGYLPVADAERERALRELEKQSRRLDQTQIFIETPYRNQKLLDSIIGACAGGTLLCIAVDITQDAEEIHTRTVAAWKKTPPRLERRPALFLLQAQ